MCMHLVTRGHLWSRDKLGGYSLHHLIRRIRKPHTPGKLHCSMFYTAGVIADRSFTLQE